MMQCSKNRLSLRLLESWQRPSARHHHPQFGTLTSKPPQNLKEQGALERHLSSSPVPMREPSARI